MSRRWWAVVLLTSLLVHIVLLAVLPGDGRWVEAVYAQHVYPLLGPVVAFLPGLLPFSVSAVMALALLLALPACLIRAGIRWRRQRAALLPAVGRAVLACAVLVAVGFHAFYLFWGYNYLRPPLEQRIGLVSVDWSAEERNAFARRFVAQASAARVPVPAWDPDELNALIDIAVADAVTTLEGRTPAVVSPLKGDFGSGFLAWQANRGVVSPFTLEAHIDFGLPPFVLAFTAAHEKAHLAGFARERDANFVAWLALSLSEDPRLRYSAYFGALNSFLNAQSRAGLSDEVQDDLLAVRLYSSRRASPRVRRASQQVYTAYLRANRMPSGLGDYTEVWQLIQAWSQRDL